VSRDGEARPAVDLGWQVAPSGEVVVDRTNLLTGATLAEMVAARGKTPQRETRPDEPLPAAPDKVLEPEPLPIEHRQAIRRYFELIRPRDEPP
jgi:hypothetical protein